MLMDKNSSTTTTSRSFEINLRPPEGTSLESTEIITNRVATGDSRPRTRGVVHAGADRGFDPAKTRNLGNIYVRLNHRRRKRDQFDVMTRSATRSCRRSASTLRTSVQSLANIGGAATRTPTFSSSSTAPTSPKLRQLQQAARGRVKKAAGCLST